MQIPVPESEQAEIAAQGAISDGNVRRASLFMSLTNFMGQTLLFFWGVYFTQINLTGVEQGILLAIYPAMAILTVIPAGFMNDRVYPRTLIAIGYLMMALQYQGLTRYDSFYALTIIFILGSIGTNLTKLSIDSFFYKTGDSKKNKQIGSYVGTYLFGSGLGVILGGFLLEKIPFTSLFQIVSVIAGLAAILSVFLLPHTETFHFDLKHYKKDLKKPSILIFVTMIFLWAIHMASEVTSYGLFLRENLGLSYKGMGLYMGVAILSMTLWARYASWLVHHKTPIRNILFSGLALSAIGHFIQTIPRVDISIIGRFIHEAGDAFMFVFLYYGIRNLFPAKRAGGNAGVVRFMQNIALIGGALIFAPLGKTYGNPSTLIIASSFSLVALMIGYYYRDLIKH
jgi:MFS family permease